MDSAGTGVEITQQEAHDLLHRLMTESIKVEAVLAVRSVPSLRAYVIGTLAVLPDQAFVIAGSFGVGAPIISFDPTSATRLKYGDARAFHAATTQEIPGAPRQLSAICFLFPDDSQITLYEIASDE